jgi:hypothetical protein
LLAALLVWAGASQAGAAGAASQQARPAGEVLVVLNEHFLNALVETIAAHPEGPSFPLPGGGREGKCANSVRLVPEAEGVKSGVRFGEGRLTAPLAFRGTYEAPLLGCLNFEGWADTAFDLRFDAERQKLDALVSVRDVKLRNIPTAFSGGITGMIQDAIDKRINPVTLLRAEQVGARLPLGKGSAGLRLRARDIRHEVSGRELRLRIFYELVPEG